MPDYLRRVERIEGRLAPRVCESPCAKCQILAIPINDESLPYDASSPGDRCDGRPMTLQQILVSMTGGARMTT